MTANHYYIISVSKIPADKYNILANKCPDVIDKYFTGKQGFHLTYGSERPLETGQTVFCPFGQQADRAGRVVRAATKQEIIDLQNEGIVLKNVYANTL